jgi:hypothetical protein
MIQYRLKCEKDHAFDSWFASSQKYEMLQAGRHLACPTCGSSVVEKALMAPNVQLERTIAPVKPQLSQPQNPQEAALAELRRKVEENSEYVGMGFASEARMIHEGNAPERAIYGEAKPEDAVKLIEDGIPVAPLPFMPPRKTN